jgi:starch-binding outer membrane protein, SusD/RagB family
MTHHLALRAARRSARRAGTAGAGILALALAACDGVLDVNDPDVTLPPALFDPSNLPALRATVIGDFALALGGSGFTTPGAQVNQIGLVHTSGLMADEFWHSGTFGQNRELDRRQVGNTNSFPEATTRALYRARTSAILGQRSYQQNQPNTAAHAEMTNYEAFVYSYLAANYCSGVPFSDETDGTFAFGAPQTTQQVNDRALEAFDRAIAIATAAGSAAQLNLARVGKARVLLQLNRLADAATVAATVPTAFVYTMEYSSNTTRQNNGVWGNNFGRREIAMASSEGGNGVAFRVGTASGENQVVSADPRTPWSVVRGAADTRSLHFFQQKYNSQASAITVASGVEARLIQAEAQLNAGASDAYLPTLNELRAGVGLPGLSDPGTPAGRVTQVFDERARWMYGTGTRLGDLRRLVRQYGRTQDQVFPTGTYVRWTFVGTSIVPVARNEGTYGNDVAFPIPFEEQNNPAYRDAGATCTTTVA